MQRLVRRDRTDKATIRDLPQEIAALRSASPITEESETDDRQAIILLLGETARQCRSRYDRELRARIPGMTGARYAVLLLLAQHEGVNQAALARILGINSMTLARLLDRLEAAGFVMRMPDPDDRRAHVLALTDRALPIIAHIRALNRKIYGDLRLGISKVEANQLRALLVRIRSNLAAD